jgi:hypothetical protein
MAQGRGELLANQQWANAGAGEARLDRAGAPHPQYERFRRKKAFNWQRLEVPQLDHLRAN